MGSITYILLNTLPFFFYLVPWKFFYSNIYVKKALVFIIFFPAAVFHCMGCFIIFNQNPLGGQFICFLSFTIKSSGTRSETTHPSFHVLRFNMSVVQLLISYIMYLCCSSWPGEPLIFFIIYILLSNSLNVIFTNINSFLLLSFSVIYCSFSNFLN